MLKLYSLLFSWFESYYPQRRAARLHSCCVCTCKSLCLVLAASTDSSHPPSSQGYKHQKAFIVAQNPLPSTIRNFWKVIFDRKCAAVVMLTPLTENGQEACSQYWPDNGTDDSYGEFLIDNLGEETNPGFVMRQLSVLNEKVSLFCCLITSLKSLLPPCRLIRLIKWHSFRSPTGEVMENVRIWRLWLTSMRRL